MGTKRKQEKDCVSGYRPVFGLLCGFLVRLDLFQVGLDEMVQSEALAVLDVFDHEVGELVHVTRGLEDGL